MRILRHRKEDRLAALATFRMVRRAAAEDVTRFGEELRALDDETRSAALDDAMRRDYWIALEEYERAKSALDAATTSTEVTAVTRHLASGRFAHACVLAARDGLPRPTRHDPCFFDPAHGPAEHDVSWAPPGGVPRDVPVCFRDHERLTAGEPPAVRTVRLGDRRVPWFASGPTYAPWAQGWYGSLVEANRFPADQLTVLYAVTVTPVSGLGPGVSGWSDPGAWEGGGMIGGHDHGQGFGGHDVGGVDGGGGGGDGGL